MSLVRVDVIVRDGDGGFVDDLTAADFRIFEDGDEQEILGLQFVDLPAGVLVDRTRPASSASSLSTMLAASSDRTAGAPSARSSDFASMS